MDKYLLWHGTRQGWISSVGTSTDLKDAIRFDRAPALARVATTKDYQGNVTVIPVREEDVI